MKHSLRAIAASSLFLVSAATVQGAFFSNTTGIASPVTTITFDEHVLADGSPLTTEYSDLGVTFGSLFYNTQPITTGAVTQPLAENFFGDGGTILNKFSIYFLQPRTDFGLGFISNDGEVTQFEAFLSGNLVASGTANTGISTVDYFGFTGGSAFDEIRMSVSLNVNGAAGIDNIQFGKPFVPTSAPDTGATVGLLGIAFAGLGMVSRCSNKP